MKKYRDFFLSEEAFEANQIRLEKRLKAFSTAYMSNAKWRKLLVKICENKELIKQCEIFDFFGSCVNLLNFSKINADFEQYIGEDCISNEITTAEYPTFYKEIEYIEFLRIYERSQVGRYTKIIEKQQDIEEIKRYLSSFGQFQFQEDENALRVLGYR